MTGGQERDGGSMAVELAIIMPLLLLLLSLVYGYGRVAQMNGTLEAGTRDAARSASQARSADQAQQVAERAVRISLPAGATQCLGTLDVVLDGLFAGGQSVTVTSTCTYPLGDLLPGVPGTVEASSSFTSPLDPNRGVR
ncbi:MAG: pilus assembly protein [Frankiales bacterium]|nr:pilus assembly protein [Frankiales bacterium]